MDKMRMESVDMTAQNKERKLTQTLKTVDIVSSLHCSCLKLVMSRARLLKLVTRPLRKDSRFVRCSVTAVLQTVLPKSMLERFLSC